LFHTITFPFSPILKGKRNDRVINPAIPKSFYFAFRFSSISFAVRLIFSCANAFAYSRPLIIHSGSPLYCLAGFAFLTYFPVAILSSHVSDLNAISASV
jgi:hypothetical protein